jgi:hypothetical protein
MKSALLKLLFFAALVCPSLLPASDNKSSGPKTISLSGVTYFQRWEQGDQHEYTPAGQEDLNRWSDMVTLIDYPSVGTGEQLAAIANAVLGNYKRAQGLVVRTASVPRTADHPAEHFISVLLPDQGAAEAAFARFVICDGVGRCIVFSHREYGPEAGKTLGAWVQKNGPSCETELMKFDPRGASTAGKAPGAHQP